METIKSVFKNKEMLKKIGFTILAFFIFKLATMIPAVQNVNLFSVDDSNGFLGILNTFTGDALRSYSIVALGIGPYITASIIIQLLQMVFPGLKSLTDEGEIGKRKLSQITRYVGIGIAFVQAIAMTFGLNSTLFPAGKTSFIGLMGISIVLTAGTAFMIWLGDQITVRGVGNGASMLIVGGIIISFPENLQSLISSLSSGKFADYLVAFITLFLFVVILVAIVFMEKAVRKVKIQYANRPAAAKFQGKSDSSFPIKLNTAGVIPVIFASTLMGIPLTLINFTSLQTSNYGVFLWLSEIFSSDNVLGFVIYLVLTFLFTIFYTFIQINPKTTAENLQKQNAYIPGFRPGIETENQLTRVLFKTTMVGALYLVVVAALPIIATMLGAPSSIQIGGTSLLIVVGVATETVKQIKTDVQEQKYSGFLG